MTLLSAKVFSPKYFSDSSVQKSAAWLEFGELSLNSMAHSDLQCEEELKIENSIEKKDKKKN